MHPPLIADVWRMHQLVVIGLLSIAIPWTFINRIGFWAVCFWSYLLLSALFTFEAPGGNHPIQFRLDQSSAVAFGVTLIIPIFIFGISSKGLSYVMQAIEVVNFANAIIVATFGYGIFNAHSMDSSVMACVTVYGLFAKDSLLRQMSFAPAMVLIPVILFLGGSTGVIALGAGIGAYFFAKRKIARAFVYTIPLAAFGFIYFGDLFLSESGRLKPWTIFLDYFFNYTNPLFGSGIGTFEWLGHFSRNEPTDVFLWAHNEYLQLLFEGGVIGLALGLTVLYETLTNSFKRKQAWLFATIVSIMVISLTQFPFRFAMSAIFICAIARAALGPDHKVKQIG